MRIRLAGRPRGHERQGPCSWRCVPCVFCVSLISCVSCVLGLIALHFSHAQSFFSSTVCNSFASFSPFTRSIAGDFYGLGPHSRRLDIKTMAILNWKSKKDTRNSVVAPATSTSTKSTEKTPAPTLATVPSSSSSASSPKTSHTQPPSNGSSLSSIDQHTTPANGQPNGNAPPGAPKGMDSQPNSHEPNVVQNGAGRAKPNQFQGGPRPGQQGHFQGPPGPRGPIPGQRPNGAPPGTRKPSISNQPTQGPPGAPHARQGSEPAQPGLQSPPPRRAPFTQYNNTNIPQYPWSQKSISNASPFPRYGHAANCIAARDGEVFVMGGLKGSNVFGDLWVIETGMSIPAKILLLLTL